MKKAIVILSVILTATTPASAYSIPELLPYIFLSNPGNQDILINNNSIDINDFNLIKDYHPTGKLEYRSTKL